MGSDNGNWVEHICSGIDSCIEQGVDVMVLSLGPDSTKFNPDHPLQKATKSAYDHHIPVVVAAGNFGPGKMQSLAKAPWVISVGAVDADERLLPISGTGLEGQPGPTVVSYGMPAKLPNPDPRWPAFSPGTSFAAPKVAGIAAFIRACIRLIISDLGAQQSGQWSVFSQFIRLPVVGVIDTGVDASRLPPLPQLAEWNNQRGHSQFQFARGKEEEQWYKSVVDVLTGAGASCTMADSPETVRRALQLIARKLEGNAANEVGAGLVSWQETSAFMSRLTPGLLLAMFCPEAIGKLGDAMVDEMNRKLGPLWRSNKVDALRMNLYDGIRIAAVRVC
ncbi:MAG: S8 family serine peptidase [Chlorobiaceae bacterium]|nr:S8 family serine peptidase [Chlorobiaceae bacterium]NTW73929.1 S8 family serine peptidase [Chlorobiaceae bacterium]